MTPPIRVHEVPGKRQDQQHHNRPTLSRKLKTENHGQSSASLVTINLIILQKQTILSNPTLKTTITLHKISPTLLFNHTTQNTTNTPHNFHLPPHPTNLSILKIFPNHHLLTSQPHLQYQNHQIPTITIHLKYLPY